MTVRKVSERQSGRRHGRPGPVGGRFALPSLRFSGAAMAMSTVLGISAATTWLVSTQQQIGRHPDRSAVGGNPPLPESGAAQPSGPADGPSAQAMPGPRALGAQDTVDTHTHSHQPTEAPQAEKPAGQSPEERTELPGSPQAQGTQPQAAARPAATSAVPLAVPSTSPSGTGSTTPEPPRKFAPAKPAKPTRPGRPTVALSGKADRDELGPSGTRHTLTLRADEPLTAVQVELRLTRPEALPGTTPFSSVPGAVVTLTQDRSTITYRFTLPALAPGSYTFGVRSTKPATMLPETWTASAFAPDTARALAVRGAF